VGWKAVSASVEKRLTSGMRSYLDDLSEQIDFDITVTSGNRDARAQAAAMLAKLQAKGEGELRSVYRQNIDLVEKLLKASRTEAAWTAIIEAEGQKLSRHLWGGAVDLRSKDLTSSQLARVKAAVRATGGRWLLEYDHLHVDLPASYVAGTLARTGAKVGLVIWLIGGAGVLGLAMYQRRKKASATGAPSAPAAVEAKANPHRRGYARQKRAANRRRR